MRTRRRVGIFCLALFVAFALASAIAEGGAIRTYLTFRITTRTQSAIVNAGEDLQIEVGVEGVTPTRYQWYFEGQPGRRIRVSIVWKPIPETSFR